MAYVQQPGNYVKFLRGTPTAWSRLGDKNEDTLYFISETGANKGKLYLGDKLIADGENITRLEHLENVFVDNDLPTNTVLVYDINKEGWVPKTFAEVFNLVVSVMTGATETTNGAAGLVPKPEIGDRTLYLRGDATWANPTAIIEVDVQKNAQDIAKAREDFEAAIAHLEGGYTGKTIPQIATALVDTAVAKLVASAPEDFDTLKEIADWIQSHDGVATVTGLDTRVGALETSVFGPDKKSGLVKDMTDVKSALYGATNDGTTGLIVDVSSLMSKVPQMQGQINSLQTLNTNLTKRVDDIDLILRWTDLVWQNDNIET